MLPRLFFFSVLLSTGASLQCEICYDSGTNCNGTMEYCRETDETCGIFSVQNSLGDIAIHSTIKDCYSAVSCLNPWQSMNFGKGRTIVSHSTCCVGEDCSVEEPKAPRNNATNGMQCPACYSTTKHCAKEKAICVGNENYCFDIVSAEYIGDGYMKIIMKGCTTWDVCVAINDREPSVIRGSEFIFLYGHCASSASKGPLTPGLLFPTSTGLLLLLKILL